MQSLPKKPRTDANLSVKRSRSSKSGTGSLNDPTFKRTKLYNSRQIRTQIQDESFTNPAKGNASAQQIRKILSNGSTIPNKLNIPEYLAAREFEIRALDSAMIKSKNSSASRVFQALPRTLRRRTASHNVRRIPKRMRRKALREMGLQQNSGTTQKVLGTKGVTINGKPIRPKIGRGKTRWALIRKMKLLKYAARWKLKGRLPNSQWISVSQINLRKRLKLLKNDLKSLDTKTQLEEDKLPNSTEAANRDATRIKELSLNIHNQLGSYDNTSVNTLSKIGKIISVQYATRQKNFKWLPTHIWHAKRAKMMKRWEWTIPLEPTQRCYRSTSRASRLKGAVAFDTSYVGSLVINSYGMASMDKILDYISIITKNKVKHEVCLSKGISWNGYVYDITNIKDPIGRLTLVFIKNDMDNTFRVMARAHPSIYAIVYNQAVTHLQNEEGVTIHDCKYSIGSIKITGPKSMTALQSILQCRTGEDEQFKAFMKLHKLNDMTTVPEGTIFTFNVCDPRFKTKPVLPSKAKLEYDDQLDILISLKNGRKSRLSDELLKPESRAKTYDNQMSLKELGKRRSMHPGETIPLKEKDGSICIMLLKSYEQWTLLTPWFWVLPFWLSLMHVPHIQFGGFKQSEQLRLERKLLGWSDMVYTTNGYVQCELEREEAEQKWEKRPKSKRTMFSKLKVDGLSRGETLSPFGLDWRGLQVLRLVSKKLASEGKLVEAKNKNIRIVTDEKLNIVPQSLCDLPVTIKAIQSAEKQLKKQNMHSLLLQYKPITLAYKDRSLDAAFSQLTFNIKQLPPLAVTPIYLTCVSKGNISPNARIYEIEDDCEHLWKEIALADFTNIRGNTVRVESTPEAGKYHPRLHNVVGLVSSATFSLVEGKSVAIGFIDSDVINGHHNGFFLVRNVASTSFVLMSWSFVDLTK